MMQATALATSKPTSSFLSKVRVSGNLYCITSQPFLALIPSQFGFPILTVSSSLACCFLDFGAAVREVVALKY